MKLVSSDRDLTPENGGDALLIEWDGNENHVEWWFIEADSLESVLIQYDDGLRQLVTYAYLAQNRREGWHHPTRRCVCRDPTTCPVCICGRLVE